jgi:hypothetical protein
VGPRSIPLLYRRARGASNGFGLLAQPVTGGDDDGKQQIRTIRLTSRRAFGEPAVSSLLTGPDDTSNGLSERSESKGNPPPFDSHVRIVLQL